MLPVRIPTPEDTRDCRPTHCVWELTLSCTLRCAHCGSRAGEKRPKELSTAQRFRLVEELAACGVKEITLIGGEAFLVPSWIEIIAHIRRHGMACSMQSGGWGLSEEDVTRASDAGLQALGFSLDGPEVIHDTLRRKPGSYRQVIRLLSHAKNLSVRTSVNTQICATNREQFHLLLPVLERYSVANWQVMLTVAMGRAADGDHLMLQPFHLLQIMPVLAQLRVAGSEKGITLQAGNNIGYFGPYETLWYRGSNDPERHWSGCSAGRNVIGIESDGTVKGCPSLPTIDYRVGHFENGNLAELWQSARMRDLHRDGVGEDCWGFCGTCYYRGACGGGCSWTAHTLFGRKGNNPFCHHRAVELLREGKIEILRQVEPPAGDPFDYGRFEIVTVCAKEGVGVSSEIAITRDASPTKRAPDDPLILCTACQRHHYRSEPICPFCGRLPS
jgi:radical SAM protein with 4Fe4S-binding SPASM domain